MAHILHPIEPRQELRVWVDGRPIPKGSMTPSIVRRWSEKQRRMVATPVAHASNPELAQWEWLVGMAADKVRRGKLVAPGTALAILLWFVLPPLKTIKSKYPTSRAQGDLDKLVRAVLDGLTGHLYDDDSCVVEITAKKEHATAERGPGVWIHACDLEKCEDYDTLLRPADVPAIGPSSA